MSFLIPHPINTAYARFPMARNACQQSFGSRFLVFFFFPLAFF